MPATHLHPPEIPKGREFFDAVMGQIEPELTSKGLKELDAKYHDETPEQLQTRKERYAKAILKYEEHAALARTTITNEANHYRHASFEEVEQEDRTAEVNQLNALSRSFAEAA